MSNWQYEGIVFVCLFLILPLTISLIILFKHWLEDYNQVNIPKRYMTVKEFILKYPQAIIKIDDVKVLEDTKSSDLTLNFHEEAVIYLKFNNIKGETILSWRNNKIRPIGKTGMYCKLGIDMEVYNDTEDICCVIYIGEDDNKNFKFITIPLKKLANDFKTSWKYS